MTSKFNYELYFNRALQQVKHIRAPHSRRADTDDLEWEEIKQQEVFCFGDQNYEKHANVVNGAKRISINCLLQVIEELSKLYGVDFKFVSLTSAISDKFKIYFALKDIKSNELLFFCDIVECSLWKLPDKEEASINKFLKEQGVIGCKYIFMMHDKAYLQIIGHNNDETDPGRGYNFFAINWFFEKYFGSEECKCFVDNIKQYIQNVADYLGYSTVKSLTPSTLVNFRKIVENTLLEQSYQRLVNIILQDKNGHNLRLHQTEYQKIFNQFISMNTYLVMIGNKDFSESLITAEWLLDSLKKAKAIDLTAIGMGYFKSMEQLLFDLICLHKNEGRNIKKDYSRTDLPNEIELNDYNITDNAIDTTFGSMAVFFRKNLDILRVDLHPYAKNYIKETIFNYVTLRNGYMHKHNIHEWEKISEIRSATYNLLFLLLGSMRLSECDLKVLGKPDEDIFTDYYRLCEYMNYHSGELFFVATKDGREDIFWGLNDPNILTDEKHYIMYSGVYLKDLTPNGQKYRITEQSLPREIYLGKLQYGNNNGISFTPVKVKKVFDNGKFTSSNIAKDDEFNY